MERRFCVTVRGRLNSSFGTAFGDIEARPVGDTTVLSGRLTDAAFLDGILACLRDLGLELIRVETGETTQPGEPNTGDGEKGDGQ